MSQLDSGLIGNCQVSALISPEGSVIWCCMPRLDSPSVFASILDSEQGGFWSIEPALRDSSWKTKQTYLRNTNVLSTEWSNDSGLAFEILDFMPRFEREHGVHRPSQLMRVVRPVRGIPRVVVRLRPKMDYGRLVPQVSQVTGGLVYETEVGVLHLKTDASVDYVLHESPFELREAVRFVFSYGTPFEGNLRFDCEEQLQRTVAYWRGWARHCNIPFEYQEEVLRSALALKLHIYEDTGAIVAATTTSIPEGPEPGRCWDYRYCWLRVAYFVVNALNRLGQFDEMEQFIRFLQNLCASEPTRVLQPVYGISGEKELVEREIPWLKGFRGFGPVRVGNAAYRMEQHDVYGEMVLALAPAFFDRRLQRTDQIQAFTNVQQLVEQAIQCFQLPDAGIWEFRGEKRHSVFSKLMNWAAVDRGIRIARHTGRQSLVDEWLPIRDRMRAEIERQGWNEFSGYYTQSYGDDAADAANLLLPAYHFISHQEERFQRTIEAYGRLLRSGRGVYRYRTADDFGIPKTTFTICSFWMVDALWGAGRKSEARDLFQNVLQGMNPLGLLSEDMDPETGELWGNFPQTYSHVGLILSAMKISRGWEEAF